MAFSKGGGLNTSNPLSSMHPCNKRRCRTREIGKKAKKADKNN